MKVQLLPMLILLTFLMSSVESVFFSSFRNLRKVAKSSELARRAPSKSQLGDTTKKNTEDVIKMVENIEARLSAVKEKLKSGKK